VIRLIAADGHSRRMGLNDEVLATGLLAYELEGETLPVLHGFPVRAVEDRIAQTKDRYRALVPEEHAERMGEGHRAMAGTPEQPTEKLRPWANAGLAYAIRNFGEAGYDTSGLELFARGVVPVLA
jgi:hypothetical protein